jgi:anti-sigma factor RsiW
MTDHLTPGLLNALADGELSAEQLTGVHAHLAACASCTSNALAQSLLKSATARAGRRYTPPPQLHERLAQQVRRQSALADPSTAPAPRRPFGGFGLSGWATSAALLLIFAGIFIFERQAHRAALISTESAALVIEACDQHIATLAANAPPQVLSSDRHTVKPWFQGRIPFSFNLPENLPSDTRLEGANLTYFHNQPAALLLYSIGKHRVSVFVLQKTSSAIPNRLSSEHAGFHVDSLTTNDLEVFAVSDVDPVRLSNLSGLIEQAQDGASQQPNQHRP